MKFHNIYWKKTETGLAWKKPPDARALKRSKSFVSQFFKLLEKEEILIRENKKYLSRTTHHPLKRSKS